jgi:hypothetical protein
MQNQVSSLMQQLHYVTNENNILKNIGHRPYQEEYNLNNEIHLRTYNLLSSDGSGNDF